MLLKAGMEITKWQFRIQLVSVLSKQIDWL